MALWGSGGMADFTAERSDVKSHEGNRVWEKGGRGGTGNQNWKFGRVVWFGAGGGGGGSRKSVNALFYMGLHGGSSCFVMNEMAQF